jgi:anti-sigma B factor antagonist
MFEIKRDEATGAVLLLGRFDASQSENAKNVFSEISKTTEVDFENLDYISSAGLSVLLMTQKRLDESGAQLILRNMNKHVREIFNYAGFDMIFKIE